MRSFSNVIVCSAALAIAVSLSEPVKADSAIEAAEHIGEMIAAEKTCDLSYDEAAIQKWIEKHVPEADLEFTSSLNSEISMSDREQSKMSSTAKVAFCAQVRRSAKANGFIK